MNHGVVSEVQKIADFFKMAPPNEMFQIFVELLYFKSHFASKAKSQHCAILKWKMMRNEKHCRLMSWYQSVLENVAFYQKVMKKRPRLAASPSGQPLYQT